MLTVYLENLQRLVELASEATKCLGRDAGGGRGEMAKGKVEKQKVEDLGPMS